jgi:hypothetical protein
MKRISWFFVSLLFVTGSCTTHLTDEVSIESPDGNLLLNLDVTDGTPRYSVSFRGSSILEPSALGFEFNGTSALTGGMKIIQVRNSSLDETWKTVWGSYSEIRNNYNEMQVDLQETEGLKRKMTLVFRLFDDGLGFRYILPEQKNLAGFEITNEVTGFNLAGDYTTWWHIANYDSYEYTHITTPVSELGDEKYIEESEYGWPAFGESVAGAANTPVTMETPEGIYLSIHEANLTDYAGMTLRKRNDMDHALIADLVPWPDGVIKVKSRTPMESPWRTIQVAETPGALIESSLLLNLNEPCAIEDTEWIRPGKYVGIWWSLHIGKWTWGAGPSHGATTENTKDYIDFAAKHEIPYVLVEGWNRQGVCAALPGSPNFLDAADDFDIDEVVRYGKERGVGFLAYNETGCEVEGYRNGFDTIFSYYMKMGIPGIKVGHVGNRLEEIYHHHGQWGVNYYQELTEKAAQYEIGLIIHEPIKSTGLERTWPNLLTKEGVAGMEQDKFIDADPREHSVEIPFTRMLAGPVDYMPGIFDPEIRGYDDMKVQTTVAKQLAMFPVFLSGFQSVTDLIENYEGRPEFQFIKDVPVTWDDTKVLNGVIGDFITMARRSGEEWYIGAMTDEESRTLTVPLDFLGEGKYLATIYADGRDADAIKNPYPVTISLQEVDALTKLEIWMAPGGGQAIKIAPYTED